MLDFEASLRNAFLEVCYAEGVILIILGCFFHFVQCVIRRIRGNSRLRKLYANNESGLKTFVRQFFALAFLNNNAVVLYGFKLISRQFESKCRSEYLSVEVQKLNNYLWREFLNSDESILQWSVRDSGVHRTNNDLESFNRYFNDKIGIHPNLWRFIEGLQMIQEHMEALFVQTTVGAQNVKSPQRQKQRQKEERINTHVKLLAERNISVGEFLKNLSHIISPDVAAIESSSLEHEDVTNSSVAFVSSAGSAVGSAADFAAGSAAVDVTEAGSEFFCWLNVSIIILYLQENSKN